jgi:hypothetical protein
MNLKHVSSWNQRCSSNFAKKEKKYICRLTFLIQRLYSRDVILEAIVVRVTMVLHTGYMWHKRSIHVSSAQNLITHARAIWANTSSLIE